MSGVLEVLDHTGDTKIEWSPGVGAEALAAKATFDSLKKKGYLAYRVDPDGSNGEVLREFDPTAGRIVMSPQMVGG